MCNIYHIITYYIIFIYNVVVYSICFHGSISKYLNDTKHISRCWLKRSESSSFPEVIISGIQPSGKLHLGNYFGCIYPCLKAQEDGKPINFMIANMHSITSANNLSEIINNANSLTLSKHALALGLACGLDPLKGTQFYYQSQIPNILRLNWIISCIISSNRVQRLIRLRASKSVSLGLICYPVLMSSDLLSIKATRVIANKDQAPHVELSRYISKKLNSFLGKEYFPLPEIDTSESKSIMSLIKPMEKMSKSDINESSRIGLLDSPDEIIDKIKGAVTDSVKGLSVEPEKRPGVTNLIRIYSKCSGIPQDEIVCDFSDSGFTEFKDSIAQVVIEFLKPIQDRFKEIIQDETYLDSISENGRLYVNGISQDVLDEFNWLF